MIKRKHIFRILLGIVLMVLIIVIAGIAVLHSRAFHRFILAKMVEEASHATGGRVEIGSFQFHWSRMGLDLNQIVLHGTEAATSPPLLQVNHLMVGVKIISLWRRRIDLNEIVIDHPTLHMTVNQNGGTNLPQPPPTKPGTPPANVFNLAIGHFVINHGEVDYNDRHIPLDGELHDLYAQVAFDSLETEYKGVLGYRDGRIRFETFSPVEHSLQAHFRATPSGLNLDSLVLDAGSSTISVQARLQDYSNPSLDGTYQATLSTWQIGNILKAGSFPAGLINLQGTLHYVNRADQPLLNNLTLTGKFHSPTLALNSPQARAEVRALAGEYSLGGGRLEIRNVQADVLGGRVFANLTLAHLSDRPQGRVAAAVHDISLQAVSAAVGASQLKHAAITGDLNGTLEGSWEGSAENVQLRSDGTITASAPLQQGAGPQGNVIPLQGALHLAYDSQSGVISVNRTVFTTPHTTVKLDGSTGKQSSLNIQASSNDLRELDQIALVARNAGGGDRKSSPATVEPLGIGGSASFAGQLRGSMNELHLTGQLSSTNLQYQGTSLSELRINVALSPSNAALSQGEIQTSRNGQVQFNVAVGLNHWGYTPQSPLRLDLTASGVSVATLEQLANLHYPVTGTLGARISMQGSQSNLVGHGSVTLAKAIVWNQPIQNLSVQFQGAGSTLSATLQLQSPAGSGSGRLTYTFHDQGYDAQFSTSNLQLEKLEAVNEGKVQISGVLTASLQGRGTVKDPQLAATVETPMLSIGQQSLNGLKLQANVAQRKVTLTLDTAAQGASIHAQANVNLDANYNSTASLDIRNVQLGPLLAAFLPQAPAGLRGQTELHGTLHGPLKQPEQVEAEVDIPTLNLAYQSLQIGNASPIRAVYRGGVASLEQCTLKGTGTELQVQAAFPLHHTQSLQAKATGTIDLHLIQLIYPQVDSSGQVRLDVAAGGSLAHPDVRGTVRVIDAVFQTATAPLGVEKLNATLAIQNGRVDIQNFSGKAGGGTLSAQGFVTLQPAVQFNMGLSAKEVRLRYPVGTRAIFDGTLLLAGSLNSALLSGQVVIDRLSFTKEFDLATFADQFNGSSSSSPGPGFAQNVKLNVSLNTASDMALATSQLSLQGSANLMVRGTLAEPVILGRTDITGGDLFFNGNRYQVQSGVISFVNPVETEPVVNLHVTTTVNAFDITMNFVGPIDRMRTTYTSNPPLAPVDIINLIATGQTTEAANASPSTPQSVIAGQLAGQFSNRVQKLAGISSLTIDPQVGSGAGSGNGVARVGIQQRVTKNLYFSFSTDLANSTAQTVQVQYQLTKRFAVSAMRDENGIYTVQVKMHKSF